MNLWALPVLAPSSFFLLLPADRAWLGHPPLSPPTKQVSLPLPAQGQGLPFPLPLLDPLNPRTKPVPFPSSWFSREPWLEGDGRRSPRGRGAGGSRTGTGRGRAWVALIQLASHFLAAAKPLPGRPGSLKAGTWPLALPKWGWGSYVVSGVPVKEVQAAAPSSIPSCGLPPWLGDFVDFRKRSRAPLCYDPAPPKFWQCVFRMSPLQPTSCKGKGGWVQQTGRQWKSELPLPGSGCGLDLGLLLLAGQAPGDPSTPGPPPPTPDWLLWPEFRPQLAVGPGTGPEVRRHSFHYIL